MEHGRHCRRRATRLSADGLLARVDQNVAVVALANKLARIVWAVLRRGEKFLTKGALSAAPAAAQDSAGRQMMR